MNFQQIMSEAEIEDMEILEARLDYLYDNIEEEIG